ncbi:MAG: amidohydrolase family protein, partial [Dehalococcoidia bacterium]|nr:amidohydrolase family protein [Dehalococcoidia bacterium]
MANGTVDRVIHGGTVVTATAAFEAAVAIDGEQITAVGHRENLPEGREEVDASGKYVFPGAIDCHVHLGLEDWEQGSRAAARAGLTTIIPFVSYNAPQEETLPAAIERITAKVSTASVVDVSLNFILTNTPYVLESLPEAMRMGVRAYKAFMTYKRWGTLMSPDASIAAAMEVIAREGGLMQLHCENGEVLDYLQQRAITEGRTQPRDYSATC